MLPINITDLNKNSKYNPCILTISTKLVKLLKLSLSEEFSFIQPIKHEIGEATI